MARTRDNIIAILFFLIIGITAITTQVWDGFGDLVTIGTAQKESNTTANDTESDEEATAPVSLASVADFLLENLFYKDSLVELSGSVMKHAGTRSYYNNTLGINITSDGYNVGCYAQTSTDYEVKQMVQFKEYLDSKGIQLLYVSEPAKYITDDFYQKEFGGESYLNRNTDLFLSRINDAGIGYIDLRENIVDEGINALDLFYRTDHHWTVPASKWAAEIISERLNEDYGYNINLDIFEDTQFNKVFYENAWLGEQGKKIAKSYIGLDDYTMIEPLYNTSYTITGNNNTVEGDFGLFIDKSTYDLSADPYTAPSWHYSYQNYKTFNIHNNNANFGKVLILGDSYESSMMPFLTLGIQDVCLIVPRDIKNRSIREIVEAADYDTVIIAYVQSMIGAHDNENSANYKMFTLE